MDKPVAIYYHARLMALTRNGFATQRDRNLIISDPKFNSTWGINGFWYPAQTQNPAHFQINILAPEQYTFIAGCDIIQRNNFLDNKILTTVICDSAHFQDNISLFAGPYQHIPIDIKNRVISTYLPRTLQNDAVPILEKASQLFELFNALFDENPSRELAIVASPMPQACQAYGICQIDETLIKESNTHHGILPRLISRNWWQPELRQKRNTSDWLTCISSYLGSYLLQEVVAPDKTGDLRYHYLRQFSTHTTRDSELPLKNCWNRLDPIQKTIMETKGCMLFFQLQEKLGKNKFDSTLAVIYKNAKHNNFEWQDIIYEFSAAANEDLSSFFDTWLNRKNNFRFSLADPKSSPEEKEYRLTAKINTEILDTDNADENFPEFALPMRIGMTRGTLDTVLQISGPVTPLSLRLTSRPREIQLDPDFTIFRRLADNERVASIGSVLQDPAKIFVMPSHAGSSRLTAYQEQIAHFNNSGETPNILFDTEISDEQLATHTLVLFGSILENSLLPRVQSAFSPEMIFDYDHFRYDGVQYWKGTNAVVAANRNPFNAQKYVLVYWGLAPESINNSAIFNTDYQKYSFIILRDGKPATWKQWRVSEGATRYRFPALNHRLRRR
ncbi:hypothetical protein KAH55_05910 [bacterium]|nr:hypothetical protein [bacterium]